MEVVRGCTPGFPTPMLLLVEDKEEWVRDIGLLLYIQTRDEPPCTLIQNVRAFSFVLKPCCCLCMRDERMDSKGMVWVGSIGGR